MTQLANPNTRAVVLAAGHGKRMKSNYPKVLHKIAGRAIIARITDALDKLELEHVHVVVGHGAKEVEEFLVGHPPKTSWSVHLQEPQLGTGHALMQVVPALTSFVGVLLVTVADTPLIQPQTLKLLLNTHVKQQAALSLLTTIVPDAKNYGRIIRNQQGLVVQIVEDKDADSQQKEVKEINPAIYCLEWPQVLSGLQSLTNNNKGQEYYLTDLIEWAVASNLCVATAVADNWREVAGVNSRSELAEACRLLNDRVLTSLATESGVTVVDPQSTWIAPEVSVGSDTIILPGCYLTGDIKIGRSCVIGPHTVMEGPLRVGDYSKVVLSLITGSEVGAYCRVGPFAHLREGVLIRDDVRVGNFVEVKKSMVGPNTNISHLSYVGNATIGAKVNIGAGTITANYDHITGLKAETVIGDEAATGSNSVLVAPVVVGAGSVVAAGTVVTRDVPDGALAVGRAHLEVKACWADRKRRQPKS
ncbi:MAG: bifunctional UDP-N-acetylglucosamine diphosphorylase/glucosamine-1-phosphate N-acetyltransferase GlmU [Candidatus Melainabacteria bacterium]|nr:bifunctional UDP-N-acetylglucosamine diphosphorylase/glucosamine-1-phosphate N-acetyltransferase GlmU [Candidatus Melainabacteria bacterium]